MVIRRRSGAKLGERQEMGPSRGHRGSRRAVWGSAGLTAAAALLPAPAFAATPSPMETTFVAIAIGTGAVALAVAAGLWALAEQNISMKLRQTLRGANARARASASARDALIAASKEPLIVWGRDGTAPKSYGGAEA